MKYPYSSQLIINAAQKRGIKITPFYKNEIYSLFYKNHQEIMYAQFLTRMGFLSYHICKQKHIAKHFLNKNNISIAEGRVFLKDDFNQVKKYAGRISHPLVIKPTNSAHGNSVFTNIKNINGLKTAWGCVTKNYKEIIVEKMHEGTEYRIFTTRNEVIGVTKRVPANVVGDGKHNISKLIEIKNNDPKRKKKQGLAKIEIDRPLVEYIKRHKIELSDVPNKGSRVFLRENSNLSTGGDSIDYTDSVHQSVKQIAIRSVRSIPGLEYAGVDFLSEDIEKDHKKTKYIIVEINASPMVSMHNNPMEGRSRDAAGAIVDIAFPETKKGEK